MFGLKTFYKMHLEAYSQFSVEACIRNKLISAQDILLDDTVYNQVTCTIQQNTVEYKRV